LYFGFSYSNNRKSNRLCLIPGKQSLFVVVVQSWNDTGNTSTTATAPQEQNQYGKTTSRYSRSFIDGLISQASIKGARKRGDTKS
jgi:hypothetical protein